jgi:hypothetical protein
LKRGDGLVKARAVATGVVLREIGAAGLSLNNPEQELRETYVVGGINTAFPH